GNYYGIEPQQWLIDEGVKKELGREILHIKSPHFSNDDDFNLSVFNRQFDFLLAQSIFSHTSIKQLRKCMTEARRVMHSRSIFLATYLPGEENYQGNTWAYPECITFTPEFMEGVIHDVGLAVLPLDWPHPGDQKWMVITEEQNIENIQKMMSFPGMHILEDKIRQQQERLKKFESNPLIKFGLRIYRFIRRG
ncbi:MAG: class I SAM-dependent methyltransferase, partial [Methanobacteriota archaeon]